MKARDLRELNEAHLLAHLRKVEGEYAELREAVRSGKEKNHRRRQQSRRAVARAKTIIHEQISSS